MNVEDYIELLTEPQYKIERSDHNLIFSFYKQLTRGLAFTDRQYELAVQKLLEYEDQFIEKGFFPRDDLENLRLPLRSIDRSRWIKIVDHPKDLVHESTQTPFIAIRFSFQKKLISVLDGIKKRLGKDGYYDKSSKTHYLAYSEQALFQLIESVEGKNFEIDELAQSIYNKLKSLNPEDYIPGVYNLEIKNLHQNGIKCITEELGLPSKENLLLYRDRSIKYGLGHIDEFVRQDESILAFKIAHRKEASVAVNNATYSYDKLFLALLELDRLPIMFILPSKSAYEDIVEINQHARNLVPSEQTCVMFRMENTGEGIEFNRFIKKEKINNRLDNDTKLVYTIDHTVPKPLLQSGWKPKAIVVGSPGSVAATRKALDCFSNVDLTIHYQDEALPSYRYFYKTGVDRIE